MSRKRHRRCFAALWLALAACSNEDPNRSDSAAAVGPSGVALAPSAIPGGDARGGSESAPADTIVDGLRMWNVANLEKRLDLQGMAPRRLPKPVRHTFLSVSGNAYMVGNAELQVFIYPDPAGVARDVALLDTVTVSPAGEPVAWPARATLITNRNLAAILLSDNALQIERVQRALMAGLSPSG
jgi:hypothetical protein